MPPDAVLLAGRSGPSVDRAPAPSARTLIAWAPARRQLLYIVIAVVAIVVGVSAAVTVAIDHSLNAHPITAAQTPR